jgi:hypothetical protein
VSGFPLDDATLMMLRAACEINPDTGRTHLHDFLSMGERVKSMTDETPEDWDDHAPRVYFVEHEEGYEPFSEHQAIRALVDEVLRLRGSEVAS